MGKAPNPPIHGLGVSFDPRPNGKSYKARATFNGQLINLGRCVRRAVGWRGAEAISARGDDFEHGGSASSCRCRAQDWH